MAKKILRQAMRVSIKELKDLADEMLKEGLETNAEIGISDPKILERKWHISIINKQPECGDTWEIEKGRKIKVGKGDSVKEIEAITEKMSKEEVMEGIKKMRKR
jgi:hypothetical protein